MQFSELKEKLANELSRIEGQKALSVKFLNTEEAITVNEKLQIWAASVIKIPIACEFFRQEHEGHFDKNRKTRLQQENRVDGTGILKMLDPEDEFTYLDLVKLMLVLSDNAATNEIIDLIGWENVEKFTKSIGLEATTFRHKMMIAAGRGPNLTTSADMAKLLEMLHQKTLSGAEEIINILKHHYDRSRIPLLIPNKIEIAHKFGSLPEAMHDVGIIYSKNPFVFVFLTDDQKDKHLTNEVLSKCAKYCFDYSEEI